MPLDEAAIIQDITDTFIDVHVVTSGGSHFIFSGPSEGADNMFPFATLVTSDEHDQASDINRDSVFRLNIGVSKATYLSLFGSAAPRAGENGIVETGYDYTTLDAIMPHPVYAPMYWVCVLNPSDKTFEEKVRPLLAEADEADVKKQEKRRGDS